MGKANNIAEAVAAMPEGGDGSGGVTVVTVSTGGSGETSHSSSEIYQMKQNGDPFIVLLEGKYPCSVDNISETQFRLYTSYLLSFDHMEKQIYVRHTAIDVTGTSVEEVFTISQAITNSPGF